jgi:16S rRNA (cytosine1402-N4)-methyltransferase
MEAHSFHHVPVLLEECIEALAIEPAGIYVDVTAGGGGHSGALLRALGPEGRLISLDRDLSAVEAATARLQEVKVDLGSACAPFEVVHATMSAVGEVLSNRGLVPGCVDGILADLGVSSHQLSTPSRGFSFANDGPLDMRMDPSQGSSAAQLVNTLPEGQLADLIYRFGDEPKSRRIAAAIVRRREEAEFARTEDLAAVVSRAVGGRRGARTHPATRTFQALRIYLNDEPGELGALLDLGLSWLKAGGRLAVITFHSGEDRAVKQYFAAQAKGCTCPPSLPVCVCGGRPRVKLVRRRGITPGEDEIRANPRARSSRLRVAELLAVDSTQEAPPHAR